MIGISNALSQAQQSSQSAMQKLISGKRINSAADDAAGLAIATSMMSQAGGIQQSISNASYGMDAIDTASSGLDQISQNLQSMRDLAVQAGNSTLNPADRQALQNTFDQYAKANADIASQTQYNGQALLNGSYGGQLQVGPNAGDTLNLSIGDASPTTLGVSALSLSSTGSAATSLDAIDSAMSQVNNMQGQLGAVSNALTGNMASQSNAYENTVAAASRIQDADMAEAASQNQRAQVQQQAVNYALQQYNAMQRSSTLGALGLA